MIVRRHADAETLAGFREDLLPRRRARRIAAHLPGCARCRELDAALTDVSTVLAGAPAPPMPAALTARIEAALAAEAAAMAGGAAPDAGTAAATAAGTAPGADGGAGQAARTRRAGAPARPVTPGAATPAAAPGGGEPARPHRAPPSRHRSGYGSRLALRVVAAAAAVVIVGGGGFGLTRLVLSHNRASPATSMQPEHAAAPVPGAASAAHGLVPSHGKAIRGLTVIASGTDYQPGRLAAQVSTLIGRAGQRQAAARPSLGPEAVPAFGGMRNLPACVTRVTGGYQPRLVDLARYRGRPAAVIVAPAGRVVHVWVVTRSCTGAAGGVLARLTLPSGG